MLDRRGTGLMVLGAALLLLSVSMFGYSRLVEWQHSVQVQAGAPPTEVLANRLPIPTRGAGNTP
ncbi:MAG: hypothetical protein JO352_30025 [Chloroflexi bacterium]|nr:hypothetical protein [Chloroflexota bacterium]